MKTGGVYRYSSESTTTSEASSIGKVPVYNSRVQESIVGADWLSLLFVRSYPSQRCMLHCSWYLLCEKRKFYRPEHENTTSVQYNWQILKK